MLKLRAVAGLGAWGQWMMLRGADERIVGVAILAFVLGVLPISWVPVTLPLQAACLVVLLTASTGGVGEVAPFIWAMLSCTTVLNVALFLRRRRATAARPATQLR